MPLKISGLATANSVFWVIRIRGLWGVFAPDDDDDELGCGKFLK